MGESEADGMDGTGGWKERMKPTRWITDVVSICWFKFDPA